MEIIDRKKLEALYGSDETSVDIIHMFIDQAPDYISSLEDAINNNQDDLLAKLCHKGIGQARYIASPPVEAILAKLPQSETQAQHEHLKTLKSYIQVIINAYK